MERGRRLLFIVAGTLAMAFPASADAVTIEVTTTVDEVGMTSTADCSLREAIRSANQDVADGGCTAGSADDQVVLEAETYQLTVTGAGENAGVTGDLDVTAGLTLTGAGAAATVIDAGSTSTTPGGARDRVLHVLAGVAVTVERLTVRGGRTSIGANGLNGLGAPGQAGTGGDAGPGEAGGGILNAGDLTLRDVTVTGNTTGVGGGGGQGAGGFAFPGGNGGDGVGGLGGAGGPGGGIFTEGGLTIDNCTITQNLTGNGGQGGQGIAFPGDAGGAGGAGIGGRGGAGGEGGGLAAVPAAEVTVSNSTIAENATGAGGQGGVGNGGFGGDAAGAGNGGDGTGGVGGAGGNGGGLIGADSVSRSTIAENATGAGGAGGPAQGGVGGAGTNGGDGGDATGGRGGAGGHGGGVYSEGSLDSSTVSANTAGPGGGGGGAGGGNGGEGTVTGGSGGNGTGGAGGEGGSGGGMLGDDSLALTASTLSGNASGAGGNGGGATAGQGGGGSAATGDGGTGGFGGGLTVIGGGSVPQTATNVTIVDNATGNGGDGADGGRGGHGAAVATQLSSTGTFRILHGTLGLGTLGSAGTGGGFPQDGSGSALAGLGSGETRVQLTILAGTCSGGFTNGGDNLSPNGINDGCLATAGDPVLLAPADNGGPTPTRALGPGSAARDRVPANGAGCAPRDQRGAVRPGGATCDIGAYEVAPPGANTGPAEAVQGAAATLTGTVEPRGLATTYRFDFGTTTAYGSETATQSTPPDPAAVAVSAAIAGLDPGTTYHYRLVATGPDGTTAGEDRTFEAGGQGGAPEITAARLSRKRFAVAPEATPVTAQRRVARGTTIRLTLSEASTVSIRVERQSTGLRVRRRGRTRCVKAAPRRLRQAPRRSRCKLFVRAGRTLTRQVQPGANAIAFSGRIGRKALRRGPHRFRITATDGSGNRSAERRLGFTIVRARR